MLMIDTCHIWSHSPVEFAHFGMEDSIRCPRRPCWQVTLHGSNHLVEFVCHENLLLALMKTFFKSFADTSSSASSITLSPSFSSLSWRQSEHWVSCQCCDLQTWENFTELHFSWKPGGIEDELPVQGPVQVQGGGETNEKGVCGNAIPFKRLRQLSFHCLADPFLAGHLFSCSVNMILEEGNEKKWKERKRIHFQLEGNRLTMKNPNPVRGCFLEPSLKLRHSLTLIAQAVAVQAKIPKRTSVPFRRRFDQVSVVDDVNKFFLTGLLLEKVPSARAHWSAASGRWYGAYPTALAIISWAFWCLGTEIWGSCYLLWYYVIAKKKSKYSICCSFCWEWGGTGKALLSWIFQQTSVGKRPPSRIFVQTWSTGRRTSSVILPIAPRAIST